MSTIRPTTDHRTNWLLASCLSLCLAVPALAIWQNRTMTHNRLLIAGGIHVVTHDILIPKPTPPDEGGVRRDKGEA